MIEKGNHKNNNIYRYIRDCYIEESNSDSWRAEIMNSKWWLPLFRIKLYDDYNYDNFMNSSNIPRIFNCFFLDDTDDIADT